MQKRITVDWDTKEPHRHLLYLCWGITNCRKVTIKRSTNDNWHVVLWLIKPISDKKHFILRKMLGDDGSRIWLDKQRQRRKEPINILFTKKKDTFRGKK